MFKTPGIILFFAVILMAMLSIWLIVSPARENKSPAVSEFSVSRAYGHLQQIAKEPHSIGTPENARVRSYIDSVCRLLGLEVEVQHTTGVTSYGPVAVAGNVYNIIARLKGEDNSKTVLLSAHYDSQPNAVGAGDDGVGVAAMLETARLLKSGKRLKNDIVFLFTDGEEAGLLGAYGFVQNSPILKELGIVLNFDNRGNSGATTMFETNPGNGWVISGYARSAARPMASSLNYEVYRTLPNSTDYTVFKETGIAGLNNAFIEGFVNYHSMTDRPENLDRNTLQGNGDNMVSLVKYFGDARIQETKRADVTYFNVIGKWMVRYPASLNIFFLGLGNLLLIVFFIMGFLRKKILVGGLIGGIFIFLAVLALLFGLNHFFLRWVRDAYPLYDHFYGSNSYNAYNYFFAMAMLAITAFSFIYQWALRKFGLVSLLGGMLLIEMIAADYLYTVAPTAIYFLCLPVISLLIAYLIILGKKVGETGRVWPLAFWQFIFSLPAVLLLSPIVYLVFVTFGLNERSSAVVIVLGLFLGLLLPIIDGVVRAQRWLIPAAACLFFLMSVGMAHLSSTYTQGHPLQTNVRYLVDADAGKAYWTSDFEAADYWNIQFFSGKSVPLPGGFESALSNDAPLADTAAPVLSLQKDTVEGGLRKVTLHCQGRAGAISARISLSDSCPAGRIIVDGKEVAGKADKYHSLEYEGLAAEGFDFMLEIDPRAPLDLSVADRSLGLPIVPGFNTAYSSTVIPGPGDNSNTVQVTKHYRF